MVKMVSLARSKDEREAANKALGTSSPVEADGIHLHLSDHHLKKLGLHGNIEAGHHLHIKAKGKVTHSSTDSAEGSKKRKSLSLHITHMGVAHKPEHEDTSSEIRDDVEKAYRGEKYDKDGDGDNY